MPARNKRSLKNLLISPESQIEYGSLFLAVAMLVHALVSIVAFEVYAAWKAQTIELDVLPLFGIVAGLVLVYLILYGFAFILGLIVSHRLYGPLVNLNRFLEKVKAGDHSARVVLRRKDDPRMRELAENLNELVARMDKGGPPAR